ncbi:MAG: DUF4974 domain-containing protein [Planctomycetota bacterium]
MRNLFAVVLLGALTCAACGSSRPADTSPSYDTSSRFVQMENQETDTGRRDDPDGIVAKSNEPITVDFVPRDPYRQGFNPVPGLEQMPFGASMFGPWRVGEAGTTVIRPSVEHRGVSQVIESSGGLSFENTSLRVVMQYIAASAGLKVRYEEEIGQRKISCILPKGPFTRNEAITLIDSICKSNQLDCVIDGTVVILRQRPEPEPLAKWTKGDLDGTVNVSFEDTELVDAIMETATVGGIQVLVRYSVEGRPQNETNRILHKKISLTMKNTTPDAILRKLAEVGSLALKVETDEEGVTWYKFDFPD